MNRTQVVVLFFLSHFIFKPHNRYRLEIPVAPCRLVLHILSIANWFSFLKLYKIQSLNAGLKWPGEYINLISPVNDFLNNFLQLATYLFFYEWQLSKN